ncbi:hypothetical protein HMPREF0972_02420 [Actinomyces sp. oral taxon 848 str. F0332]|nr:hypothetical protein HMPREF0972_02420 [Actinomyces sp. oral taxon 848 str. F0332]
MDLGYRLFKIRDSHLTIRTVCASGLLAFEAKANGMRARPWRARIDSGL